MRTDKHGGSCFCGAVDVEVSGTPAAMDDCHCRSCRSCSAGPVNAFTRWQPDSVKVARRAEFVGHFRTTETRDRPFCTRCGGHLMTDHPPPGLTDVCAATIPSRAFVPGFHVNHAEIVLPIKHGLPELRGFPPSWMDPPRACRSGA